MKSILMEIYIEVILSKVKLKEKVYTFGVLQVKNMKENGRKESDVGEVFGKEQKLVKFILETGKKIERMDMELILGLTEIDMMVNGLNARNKEKEQISFGMEIGM